MATGYLYYSTYGRSVTNIISQHKVHVQVQGEGRSRQHLIVNICTNQNETLKKQIHNSQKSIKNPYQPMDF
jgi:hypothetical protein